MVNLEEMRILKILFVLILMLLFSCNSESNNSALNDCYPMVRSLSMDSNDVYEYCIKEYQDTLIQHGRFVNGYPNGKHYFFDTKGKLVVCVDYTISDSSDHFVNQVFRYNNNGELTNEGSNYYTITLDRSTVLSDTLGFFISLEATFFNNRNDMYVFIENSDSTYYSMYSDSFKVYYKVARDKYRGEIKGQLIEYLASSNNPDSIVNEKVMLIDEFIEL